jgi:two-component system, sensor histidine kinase and response regulator
MSDSVNHPPTVPILVLEDDEHVGDLIATVLNEVPGWAATVVTDASAAVTTLQQVAIKAILPDINLPGISGLELLSLLRADPAWREPPVILMSANEHQAGIRETVSEGLAVTFLAKPLDLDVLIETIETALSV